MIPMVGEEPPSRDASTDDLHIRTSLIADVRGYTLFTQERARSTDRSEGCEVSARIP